MRPKLVGVVKCTDRMVAKWESDDQANELYPSVLSLKSKQSNLEEVCWPELEVFRHPNNATYTPLKMKSKFSPQKYRVRLILECNLYGIYIYVLKNTWYPHESKCHVLRRHHRMIWYRVDRPLT